MEEFHRAQLVPLLWTESMCRTKFPKKMEYIYYLLILIGLKKKINLNRWFLFMPHVIQLGKEMLIRISFGNGEDPDTTVRAKHTYASFYCFAWYILFLLLMLERGMIKCLSSKQTKKLFLKLEKGLRNYWEGVFIMGYLFVFGCKKM